MQNSKQGHPWIRIYVQTTVYRKQKENNTKSNE